MSLAAAAGAIVALVGVEVIIAATRDYLPTQPALEIGGVFGPPDAPSLTLVVLGDSTAAGVGAGVPERAYPTLLAEGLSAERRVSLVDFGVSGARVHDVLVDQAPRALAVDPDLLFVAIGGNDVTHLTWPGSVAADMDELLQTLAGTGAPIVVAGPPDMRVPAFPEPLRSIAGWYGRRIEGVIGDAARARGVSLVPLADETRAYFKERPETYYSSDLFHPSAAGYRKWAAAILPLLREVAP